jgi:nuclear pore complex protein Nup62
MTHYEKEITNFTNDSSKPLAAKLPADREREKS